MPLEAAVAGERQSYILSDCGARIVLSQERLRESEACRHERRVALRGTRPSIDRLGVGTASVEGGGFSGERHRIGVDGAGTRGHPRIIGTGREA